MKVTISGLDRLADSMSRTLEDLVQRVSVETEIAARQNTPVRSGRARNNWRRQTGKEQFTVTNTVPYIERLEAGASKQAPRGIIGPTLTQVKGKFK
jgi:HK97 gp10 family phage protein